MRKIKQASIWLLVIWQATFYAWGQDHLSPLVRSLLPSASGNEALAKAIEENCHSFCVYSGGTSYLSGTMLWSEKPDVSTLQRQGIRLRSIFSFGASVLLPPSSLEWLSTQKWLRYLDLDHPKDVSLKEQRRDIRADEVQAGIGDLPKSYEGEDVIIAVIDQGFDYSHPTFWDAGYQNTRILFVWDQEADSGTPPDGYSYGNVLYPSELKAAGGDSYYKTSSHGSNVAGIAAGSGEPSPGTSFRGVAPASNIILISSDLSDSKVSDGLRFAASYAKSVNKPLSVNMSFGGYGAAIDGTGFLDQAINEAVGPGCIVSTAIGNEGDVFQYASFTSDGSSTSWKSALTAPAGYPEKALFQVWGDKSSSATIRVGLLSAAGQPVWTSNAYSSTSGSYTVAGEGDWSFKFNTYSSYAGGNRSLWNVDLVKGNATYTPFLEVIPASSGERFHILSPYMNLSNQLSTDSLSGFSKGDTVSNGRSPGMTCLRAISVAAHVAKDTLFPYGKPRLIDKSITLGELCYFSSRGPSITGLVKPDISAPGYMMSSAISSSDYHYPDNSTTDNRTEFKAIIEGKTYRYYPFYGTSMATPVVAGSVALLLQANPLLTPEQLKQIFSETARKDAFTHLAQGEKNNRFGFGKIDLYSAMLKTLNITPTVPQGSEILSYPNPVSSDLNLILPAETEFQQIRFFNMIGQEVLRKEGLSGSYLNLSVADVRQGQYMLQIQTNKGRILRQVLINR